MLVCWDGREVVAELEFYEVGQEGEEEGEADAVGEVGEVESPAFGLREGSYCEFSLGFLFDFELTPG